jgi:predicted nucleotidyltransferase
VRRPRDRDFVETADGLFFCVIGYVHPPARYAA